MALWSDLAAWHGPTPNRNTGKQVEVRGVVIHIADGFYGGTIEWQKNPAAEVSSHFIVGRTGTIAQMVDTADKAWTQRSGNGHWISIEFEGFSTSAALHKTHPGWERLDPRQIESAAKLFARVCRTYGVPVQNCTSPSGKGLGHHSMGAESGVDWGHSACPGAPIKAQKEAILARTREILNPVVTPVPPPVVTPPPPPPPVVVTPPVPPAPGRDQIDRIDDRLSHLEFMLAGAASAVERLTSAVTALAGRVETVILNSVDLADGVDEIAAGVAELRAQNDVTPPTE